MPGAPPREPDDQDADADDDDAGTDADDDDAGTDSQAEADKA